VSTTTGTTSRPLSREAMDRMIEQHFRQEAEGDVEGTLAHLTDAVVHDVVGDPVGVLHGPHAVGQRYGHLFSNVKGRTPRSSTGCTARTSSSTTRSGRRGWSATSCASQDAGAGSACVCCTCSSSATDWPLKKTCGWTAGPPSPSSQPTTRRRPGPSRVSPLDEWAPRTDGSRADWLQATEPPSLPRRGGSCRCCRPLGCCSGNGWSLATPRSVCPPPSSPQSVSSCWPAPGSVPSRSARASRAPEPGDPFPESSEIAGGLLQPGLGAGEGGPERLGHAIATITLTADQHVHSGRSSSASTPSTSGQFRAADQQQPRVHTVRMPINCGSRGDDGQPHSTGSGIRPVAVRSRP
jgi:hypothetical protein